MLMTSKFQSLVRCLTASTIWAGVRPGPEGCLRTSSLPLSLTLTLVPPMSMTRMFMPTCPVRKKPTAGHPRPDHPRLLLRDVGDCNGSTGVVSNGDVKKDALVGGAETLQADGLGRTRLAPPEKSSSKKRRYFFAP